MATVAPAATPASPSSRHTGAYGILFVALVLVSTSGPFIRLAGMDAYTVVLLRMAGAAPLYLAWAFATGRWRIAREHVRGLVLGALLLTAHFLLWVKAFDLTDFSSNLLLLVMQPVIAAFLGIRLGERPTRETWIAITLAVVGLGIIAGGDFRLGPRALLGDAMCVAGDAAIALFYVVGNDARRKTPLPAFMGWTLAIGSVATLPVVLLADSKVTGYAPSSYAWLGALVLCTTMAGHGLMNVAANQVRLFALNLVIVLEPAIAILMGAALFDAHVTTLQLAGGVFLAASVVVGLRAKPAP